MLESVWAYSRIQIKKYVRRCTLSPMGIHLSIYLLLFLHRPFLRGRTVRTLDTMNSVITFTWLFLQPSFCTDILRLLARLYPLAIGYVLIKEVLFSTLRYGKYPPYGRAAAPDEVGRRKSCSRGKQFSAVYAHVFPISCEYSYTCIDWERRKKRTTRM